MTKKGALLILIICICTSIINGQDENLQTKSAFKMEREELIKEIKRLDTHTFEVNLYSKFFEREVSLKIFSGDSTNDTIVISDYLVDCIDDFINYDNSEIEKIKSDIYEDYKIAIRETDYGMVPDELLQKHNNDFEKANQEYFNIKNKDEAFEALTLNYAMVVEYTTHGVKEEGPRYVGFFFERPWDDEHELQIELENRRYKQIL